VVFDSPRFLRRGGGLLLEVGGAEADLLDEDFARLGYRDLLVLRDEDGDVRGVEATLGDR
jgi:release factor glutamine methyltransferase